MGLKGTILPPNFPESIPSNSKWLSGQGAGCWFSIEKSEKNNWYIIKRYTYQGVVDCNRIFELVDNGSNFDLEQPYEFVHISHCSKCKIQQKEQLFIFQYHPIITSK